MTKKQRRDLSVRLAMEAERRKGPLHPVRARRYALFLTQRELAAKAGVSTGLLSRVETRWAVPHPNRQLHIARALRIKPAELWPEVRR
jgi:ribosome-binding protein aMBF1 (putative translation factor)